MEGLPLVGGGDFTRVEGLLLVNGLPQLTQTFVSRAFSASQ